ncbi:MAG: hypothetical protein JNJ57_18910 [Saprospiraceae bacterium]|nr:hypothetical protein [Saprospiraceae bacterium]
MKKHTHPLRCGVYYHIYNRGINGEDLFKEERNYPYFLKKYAQYIQPVADTYAYCLLKNHFHLLVRTKSAADVIINVGRVGNPSDVKDEMFAAKLISNQFAKLFNSYAQSINKAYGRTGGLFEELFRRIPVNNERYFNQLVFYIHANPQRHGFVLDFRNYPHSSYRAYQSLKDTSLKREELIQKFGNLEAFSNYHNSHPLLTYLPKFEIEVD